MVNPRDKTLDKNNHNATESACVPIIDRLRHLASRYDSFILDLWGVIHDGVTLFAEAATTLAHLQRAGKSTVFLSNAPRRTHIISAQLTQLGVARTLYKNIVSSGQAAYDHLVDRQDPWHAALGRRCLHIGPPRDNDILTGLDVEIVADPAQADFILNTGPWEDNAHVEDYLETLQKAAQNQAKMVCCNPDREVIRGGKRLICAGALAQRYTELGGEVRSHGKPDPAMYTLCFQELGHTDHKRTLAVGDSLTTDIAGARAAGIDSLLITSGVHGAELGCNAPTPQRLEALFAAKAVRPTYVATRLVW